MKTGGNTPLKLNSKYSWGHWKGKSVKEVIDENYFVFDAHWAKKPKLYGKDVKAYMKEVEKTLRKYKSADYFFRRSMHRSINMPNT
jgi:hypothetical protein